MMWCQVRVNEPYVSRYDIVMPYNVITCCTVCQPRYTVYITPIDNHNLHVVHAAQ